MRKAYLLAIAVLSIFMFSVSAANANESAASAIIRYDLAFPGILPDHPLYKLKVLRDKISPILIRDPKKKIEFYLLQADKGVLATAMLIDKNEIKLAEETALKAENNMTLLTFELKRSWEKPSKDLFEKLKTASLKHQEVLSLLADRVPSENKENFIRVVNFSKTNLQTIEKQQTRRYFK